MTSNLTTTIDNAIDTLSCLDVPPTPSIDDTSKALYLIDLALIVERFGDAFVEIVRCVRDEVRSNIDSSMAKHIEPQIDALKIAQDNIVNFLRTESTEFNVDD